MNQWARQTLGVVLQASYLFSLSLAIRELLLSFQIAQNKKDSKRMESTFASQDF